MILKSMRPLLQMHDLLSLFLLPNTLDIWANVENQ